MKRLNQIESTRRKRWPNLVAWNAVKMKKYRNAARDILTPKVGYGLADELKRVGFLVKAVADQPQAADVELRHRKVDMIDMRMVEYLVLVSDDSDFVKVLKEARMSCLKTVDLGNISDGALKRTADAAFSWQEIMIGKMKKEAVSVVGNKDRYVLQKLEWTYDPERDKRIHFHAIESGDSNPDIGCFSSDEGESLLGKKKKGVRWELRRN